MQRGDVRFLWNFAGLTCGQAPEVQSVRITIPGETLANAGVYPCSSAGTDGVQLLDFAAGTYAFTIEGRSSAGTQLYQATGNFVVNGNVTVNVTLASTATTASALVSWTFPPNSGSSTPDCTQAGVVNVTISLDGASPIGVSCTAGLGASTRLDGLVPGPHNITLEAADAAGFVYYRKTSGLNAQLGSVVSRVYAFDWAVGSLPVKWTFSNGITQLSCAQAGVSQVNVNLRDGANNLVYGAAGVDVPCLQAGWQGTEFPFLSDGLYALYLQAYGTGGVVYRTNFAAPPSVDVFAGQFPVLDASTPARLLTP